MQGERKEVLSDGFLRLPDVLAVIPVSASSWWNGIRVGKYPKGKKLGPRTTAWRRSDIQALIDRVSGEEGACQHQSAQ